MNSPSAPPLCFAKRGKSPNGFEIFIFKLLSFVLNYLAPCIL
jgi:hypothetical protein